MRVLCQVRPDFLEYPGAETAQLLGTRPHLEKLGVKADVAAGFDAELWTYDVIHLFGTWAAAPTYAHFQNAKLWGKPVLLSPFYSNPLDNLEWRRAEERQRLVAWWEVTNNLRREVLAETDLLAPASEQEAAMIRRDFKLARPYQLVHPGVDRLYQHGEARRFTARYGQSDFVLCVGRLEPQRNQLGLIEALAGTDLPLVFVGPPGDPEYAEACATLGGAQAFFFPALSPLELADAYAAARVFVAPGWEEAPGQASLAAGLAGCNVVVSDRAAVREHLGDDAWYCRPGDLSSIQAAVLMAWEAPRAGGLRTRLLDYTWERAAIETLRAYESLLERA
ncbi:MAG: glycosyltransferase [Chitinophagales bacterium]